MAWVFCAKVWLILPCPAHMPSHTLPLTLLCAPQELEETYQDAAGSVLVAICRHSWQRVVRHLETQVLTGTFPHRSLLYVLGILSSVGRAAQRGCKPAKGPRRRAHPTELPGPHSTRPSSPHACMGRTCRSWEGLQDGHRLGEEWSYEKASPPGSREL